MEKKTTRVVSTSAKRKPAAKRVKKLDNGLTPLLPIEAFKTAALVVSLLINIFILCIWVVLQVTSQYDQALFDFFVNR